MKHFCLSRIFNPMHLINILLSLVFLFGLISFSHAINCYECQSKKNADNQFELCLEPKKHELKACAEKFCAVEKLNTEAKDMGFERSCGFTPTLKNLAMLAQSMNKKWKLPSTTGCFNMPPPAGSYKNITFCICDWDGCNFQGPTNDFTKLPDKQAYSSAAHIFSTPLKIASAILVFVFFSAY